MDEREKEKERDRILAELTKLDAPLKTLKKLEDVELPPGAKLVTLKKPTHKMKKSHAYLLAKREQNLQYVGTFDNEWQYRGFKAILDQDKFEEKRKNKKILGFIAVGLAVFFGLWDVVAPWLDLLF